MKPGAALSPAPSARPPSSSTRNARSNGLNDSKQLTEKRRDASPPLIRENARSPGRIGWASVEEIDEINIRQANFRAMKRAFAGARVKPTHVLVDGKDPPPLRLQGHLHHRRRRAGALHFRRLDPRQDRPRRAHGGTLRAVSRLRLLKAQGLWRRRPTWKR
jgi:hypothetical protein